MRISLFRGGAFALVFVLVFVLVPLALSAKSFGLPAGTPAGTPAGAPAGAPTSDSKLLLKEFAQAQANEMSSLLKLEKQNSQELKAFQSAQLKDFDLRETDARRKYFLESHRGEEKRAYVRDSRARRGELVRKMGDDRATAKKAFDERVRALSAKQSEDLRKFEDALKRGERPDDSLWPQPGPASGF